MSKVNTKRLKLARIEAGLSVSKLAKLSNVSRNTITLIEQEKVLPRTYILGRIAKILNVPVQEFLVDMER